MQTSLEERCFPSEVVPGQKLADTGISTRVAQLLVAAGPCLVLKPGIFFVVMERMDNGKARYLSHTLLPYGLPTWGMTRHEIQLQSRVFELRCLCMR